MSSLENYLRDLAVSGPVKLHLWPVHGGGFQANVAEPGVRAWTVVHDEDPIAATREALRQRSCGVSSRTVEAHDGYVDAPTVEQQIDIEEAIAAAPEQHTDPDGFCMICEGGGCDLCSPTGSSDDPLAGLMG